MHQPSAWGRSAQHLADWRLCCSNLVRRPVSQVRSSFSYARVGDRPEAKRLAQLAEYNETYTQCVDNLDPHCGTNGVLFRFLGPRYPRTNAAYAERIDEIVRYVKRYTAIGVVEHWPASVALFERMLPGFFAGASAVVANVGVANKTPTTRVRAETRDVFTNDAADANRILYHMRFSTENSLYEYLLARFEAHLGMCAEGDDGVLKAKVAAMQECPNRDTSLFLM